MPFKYILFNKPFGVLSQFTDGQGRPTLKDYVPIPGVYPCGRLDLDSEGLLLLSDDGDFQHSIADPERGIEKTYLVQIEGEPTAAQIRSLERGVLVGKSMTLPAHAKILEKLPIALWERAAPIRKRKRILTAWISLSITEGRNRQVRRMTAAVGLPCLRLIRISIGAFHLGDILPGKHRDAGNEELASVFNY